MTPHKVRPGPMGIPTCAVCGAMRQPGAVGGRWFDFERKRIVSDDCDEARKEMRPAPEPTTRAPLKGYYVTTSVPGAIPNDTIVEKTRLGANDTHAVGARARVLGSIPPPAPGIPIGYFVEWRDTPGLAVLVGGDRIRAVVEKPS